MAELQKAQIRRCPNLLMAGRHLRKLRVMAGFSTAQLAKQMGTYRTEIRRWEKKKEFELGPQQMEKLLKVLGATSL